MEWILAVAFWVIILGSAFGVNWIYFQGYRAGRADAIDVLTKGK